MDNRYQQQQKRAQLQKQAERRKYQQRQMYIRIGGILLAIILSLAALLQSCSTRRAVSELATQLRAKKLAQAQEELMAMQQAEAEAEPSETPVPSGQTITLSFAGEVTLGVDANREDGFLVGQYYDSQGPSYFFQNVRSIFEGDDLTTASLVGSLTLVAPTERVNWNDAYQAEPGYAEVFTNGGIEAVTVANAHVKDFGESGYVDTLANLDNAGVARFGLDNVLTERIIPGYGTVAASESVQSGLEETADPDAAEEADTIEETMTASPESTTYVAAAGGVLVGYTGVFQKSGTSYEDTALENIQTLQEQGAQIIVVEIGWTSQNADMPDDSQILTAHKLIDAGADLVIGIQPYILQGIEQYHGKYIVYSLGSFMTPDETPKSYDSIIYQQSFVIEEGQEPAVGEYNIIPCRISSVNGVNDCRPTPYEEADAQRVLDSIYDLSAQMDGGIYPPSQTGES